MTEPAIVEKIRKLLAKAEGTDFAEEAEAFYAKAQQLMIDYAIEEQQLIQKGEIKQKPVITTIHVKTNESGANWRRALINSIGRASNCRVWYSGDEVTVVGYESDTTFVELLYASLLMQLKFDMLRAMVKPEAKGINSRTFRSNFTRAFTLRVDERLQETIETTTGSKALVLKSRMHDVNDFVDSLGINFGSAQSSSGKFNEKAFTAGKKAGDKADISGGRYNIDKTSRKELR